SSEKLLSVLAHQIQTWGYTVDTANTSDKVSQLFQEHCHNNNNNNNNNNNDNNNGQNQLPYYYYLGIVDLKFGLNFIEMIQPHVAYLVVTGYNYMTKLPSSVLFLKKPILKPIVYSMFQQIHKY